MKKHRDYTSLDVGFIHFLTLHPLFEEPSVQLSCLNLFASFHPELDITENDILECIGTKLEDFNSLPLLLPPGVFRVAFWLDRVCGAD
jgi:hypothetical protein